MLTHKQLHLLMPIRHNLFREYSFKEFKGHEKSNQTLQRTIKKYKTEKLITEREVGNVKLYKPNLQTQQLYSYLTLLNQEQLSVPVQLVLKILHEELARATPFYALVIFGSYAIGEQKKTSDLDIAIIVEQKTDTLQAVLRTASMKTPVEIDAHIITKKDFLTMLTNEEENLGKQIARKHLVIHNAPIFYTILIEGIQHGFTL